MEIITHYEHCGAETNHKCYAPDPQGNTHAFCCADALREWREYHRNPYHQYETEPKEVKRPAFWFFALVAMVLAFASCQALAEELDYFPKGATVYVDGFPICYQQEWAEAVAQTHYENGVEQATDLFSRLSQQRECGVPTMGTALIVGEMVYSNDTVRVIEMLGAPVPVYLITVMEWRPE